MKNLLEGSMCDEEVQTDPGPSAEASAPGGGGADRDSDCPNRGQGPLQPVQR